jgi:hypothetical protein
MEADGNCCQDFPPRQIPRFRQFYRATEAGRYPASTLAIDEIGGATLL